MIEPELIELKLCEKDSIYWAEVEQLFKSEWSDFNFSDSYNNNEHLPLPPVIVALVDKVVIGGLAYSLFTEPHEEGEVIWFNALFVKQEYRGKGIASQLIHAGISQVSRSIQKNLYVYTNVPALYYSLGWIDVDIESEANHKVMCFSLRDKQ